MNSFVKNPRKDIKVVLMTSDKTRHDWVSNIIEKHFSLVLIVTEKKPKIYKSMVEQSFVIKKHFKQNNLHEDLYLTHDSSQGLIPKISLTRGEINNVNIIEFVKSKNPDIIMLYGTSILKKVWFNNQPKPIINMHLGLSPYYKGSGTNFWPLFNSEPEYIGVTIHVTNEKVDSGDIITQVRPEIDISDSIYDINMKTIIKGANAFINGVIFFLDKKRAINQSLMSDSKSKVYKKKNLTEDSILKVHENFSRGMISRYLSNKEKLDCKVKIIEI